MMGRTKWIYVAGLITHFVLIILVTSRQTLSVFLQNKTAGPGPLMPRVAELEHVETMALGGDLPTSNLWRRAVVAYTNGTGINTGYGFFAPTVAIPRKLVFEIRYASGEVEYELPRVGDKATGLRLVLLLEAIANTDNVLLRKTMLKMMAFSVWQRHREAEAIRVVFGTVMWPSASEFRRGKRAEYDVLFAYDFRFSADVSPLNR